MQLTLRNSLETLFTRRDQSRRGAVAAPSADARTARRLELFCEKREEMIRPVMEAVGGFLVAKGYEFEIMLSDPRPVAAASEMEASISFHVIEPPRKFHPRDYPGLSIVCDAHAGVVRFRVCRIAPSASASPVGGAVMLDELTMDLVQDQMMGFLTLLFPGG